jgi:hypothetical protein
MKVLAPQGSFFNVLMKAHSRGLVSQKELFDLACGGDGERSGEQMLTLPNIASEHGFADYPQSKPRLVAGDLPIEWRIAIDEVERKAELIGIEIA